MNPAKIDLSSVASSLNRPLVLDGAIGTLLIERNYISDKLLWTSLLNMTSPVVVQSIHKEYIEAGADIITTNTFRTNPTAVKKSNLLFSLEEFVRKSVKIAVDLKNENLVIAGCNAPAEDCYQIERNISKYELEYNHKKHIELLSENGCDIILNETISHWDEIEIICKYCAGSSLPYIISLYFTDELKLLSGEPVSEAI